MFAGSSRTDNDGAKADDSSGFVVMVVFPEFPEAKLSHLISHGKTRHLSIYEFHFFFRVKSALV